MTGDPAPASARPQPPRWRWSSLAFLGLGLAAVYLVAAALAGLGHRWGYWGFRTGFTILRWAAYGALLSAAISVAGFFRAVFEGSWGRLAAGLAGIGLGLSVAYVPLRHLQTGRRVPPIHDITTDTENPPRFVAIRRLRKGAPNPAEYAGPETAALQRKGYPDLGPARFHAPPGKVFARALAAARALGWKIAAAVPAEGRIEGTDTTFWFGFKDDVVIRIRKEGAGTRVDVRSKSRVGRSDVGANARRIRAFLRRLRSGLPAPGP